MNPIIFIGSLIIALAGLALGLIISLDGYWPHPSSKIKTIMGFIVFGPIFWALSIFYCVYHKIYRWLKEEE